MTHLTTLSAAGLKSGDFEITLNKVNLIVGPSRSGKTRVLDAARLALSKQTILGRNRELKGTGAAVMELARNGRIDVNAVDSKGRLNQFSWKRGKACQVVTEEIPLAESVLMDSGEYFRLSDPKKVEYAFSLFRMDESEEFSGPGIIAALKNIKLPDGQNTAETEASLRAIVGLVDESDTARHEQGQNIQDWLAEQIKSLKERLSCAKATADRMTKLVAGITQITANEAPARNFKGELTAKQAELDQVNGSIGAIEEKLRAYGALLVKVEDLRGQLERCPAVPIPYVDGQVNVFRDKIHLINGSGEDKAFADEIAKLTDEADGLQDIVNAYQSVRPIAEFELKDEREALEGLTNKKNNLAQTVSEETTAHEEMMRYPCCPSCGTPMESMRLRLTQAFEKRMAEHKATHEHVLQLIEQSKETIAKITRELQKATESDQANAEKQKQVQAILRQIKDVMGKRETARISRANTIANCEDHIRGLEASVKTAERKNKSRDEIARALAAAEAELAEQLPDALKSALQTAKLDRMKLESEIQILRDQQRDYDRQQDDERRNAQALVEHAKAQADLAVTKAAIETLEGIQTRMVETAFGAILKTVNAVTAGIIPEPIVYREGVLGRWAGKTWISHETFSGTEKALTYAGLSLALADRSEIKAVLIDELGIMDHDTLAEVLARMRELTERGVVGQFIGAASLSKEAALQAEFEGVNVIRV